MSDYPPLPISENLLTSDHRTLDAKSVTFEIWKNRMNKDFVSKFVEILSKFIDEKRVFNDVEFYLPQLAHMVIHLDVDWNNKALERFAILISEASVHTALQLSFILIAAMEDYQPEDKMGVRNPQSNPTLFFRCARLMQNVERAVIFGMPELSAEEETAMQSKILQVSDGSDKFSAKYNHITHDNIIKLVNRIVDTGAIVSRNDSKENKSELLLYKRITRKGMFYRKPWKPRYVTVEQRVLIVYHDASSPLPLRTLPLQGCSLVTPENAKYPFYFEIVNPSTGTKFLLRATTQASYDKWMNTIKREIEELPDDVMTMDLSVNVGPGSEYTSVSAASELSGHAAAISKREASMTSYQRKRFKFFEQQLGFVTALTDICERLRFMDRDVRKFFLKRDIADLIIPPFVYLPLCSSSDRYRYILRSVPSECYAFSTKARCPALVFFEVEEHPSPDLDYLTFLSQDIWDYSEEEIIETRKQVAPVLDDSSPSTTINTSKSANANQPQELPSRISRSRRGYSAWREEGTALSRMSLTVNPSAVEIQVPDNRPSRSSVLSDDTHRRIFIDSETFETKEERVKSLSPYKHLPNWKLDGLIAKSNDDVRQEVFVMQMIVSLKRIFKIENVDVWIHTYKILSTSKSTGLIELIKNATSLDGLKKKEGYPGSLRKYYEVAFGYTISALEPPSFTEAVDNYVKSMAGYSIVCYLLAIKDRHNGNIMIDAEGHVIHIDFGFVFGLAPGKAFSMEKAPFKLNEELGEVMGGPLSYRFAQFTESCTQALLAARKHAQELITMMEIMQYQSNFPAFRYNRNAIRDFQSRLHLDKLDSEIPNVVKQLVNKSYKHKGPDYYDSFQLLTNKIAK